MASALGPIQKQRQAIWIGWHGLERPLTASEYKALQLPTFARHVDIPANAYQDYYYGVSNGVLWPALHGFQPRTHFTKEQWEQYRAVNELFAEAVAREAKPDDLIWIHDFHLFLLPGLLRRAGLKNRIGFFLHIPVADSGRLHRTTHWRDALASLAHVDLMGLQTSRDADNLRQAYLAAKLRSPRLGIFPVGIDPTPYRQAAGRPKQQLAPANGRQTVLSISRLDYTKGILEQLQAVDELLTKKPKLHFVYQLIVAPSREGLAEYRELKEKIEKLVADINQRHPGAVDYHYVTYELDDILTAYRQADVMLVTPLIDGMNLITKEYVAARDKPGVLILSKTIGAARQLTAALQVDPGSSKQIAKALAKALSMSSLAKKRRWHSLQRSVETEDVYHWANTFLEQLNKPTV